MSDFTIERCEHDAENPYTMVSTSLIRDENLHPITRWILIMLLSNKDNWNIRAKQFINLLKVHGIGRDKTLSFFKQACEVGYMEKQDYREGNLRRCRYIFSEKPKFKKSFPHPSETTPAPGSSEPGPEQPAYKYNHRSSKEELKKEDCAGASSPPLFSFKRVQMTTVHYQKLLDDIGQEKMNEMLERLDEYADINPKRFKQYANHATVIRSWLRKEESSTNKPSTTFQKIVEKMQKTHEKFIQNGEIEILNNKICFKKGTFYLELDANDKNFETRLHSQLRKMNG